GGVPRPRPPARHVPRHRAAEGAGSAGPPARRAGELRRPAARLRPRPERHVAPGGTAETRPGHGRRQPMRFGATRSQIYDAQKTARTRWTATEEDWSDSVRQEHGDGVVEPLDHLVAETL